MVKRFLVNLFMFVLLVVPCMGEEINEYELGQLSHVRGCQSVGIRGGHGTKNLFDVGLTYTYCFSNKISLLIEVDHERWNDYPSFAELRTVEHTNWVMLSPGFEHNLLNPVKWFYWNWGFGAAVGYDRWKSLRMDYEEKCFVYGMQAGTGLEFMPWTRFSFVLKAQQYLLFSKSANYLKPNFSLAFRINFHG